MKEFTHAIAILLGYDDAVSLTRREEERGLATPAFWDDVRVELGRLYRNAGADLDLAMNVWNTLHVVDSDSQCQTP